MRLIDQAFSVSVLEFLPQRTAWWAKGWSYQGQINQNATGATRISDCDDPARVWSRAGLSFQRIETAGSELKWIKQTG
jgi:hypothetical protein